MTAGAAQLVIRPIQERDVESLSRSLGLSLQHIQARWQEQQQGWRTMLVAEHDGGLVGSVSFRPRDELPGLLHLFALGVEAEHQSRGIGSALIAAVEQEARTRGMTGVHLAVGIDNEGAIRLYRRLGFQRRGTIYTERWTWYGPDGETREVEERCFRMVKLLMAPVALPPMRARERAGHRRMSLD